MIQEDQTPPMPLEWHPAFADKTYLLDWLNGVGYLADKYVIQYYVYKSESLAERVEKGPFGSSAFTVKTLTRQQCWGPAPYVGDPFVYAWFAAVDDLGRGIAGESHIQYTGWQRQFDFWRLSADGSREP